MATDGTLNEALNILAPVFRVTNSTVNVNKVIIATKETAAQYRLISSPTIRVNGMDICCELKESACKDGESLCGDSVDCRVFVYEGKNYEQPPAAMIVDGILRVLYGRIGFEEQTYTMPVNIKNYFEKREMFMKTTSGNNTSSCCESQTTPCCGPQKTSCCEPQATSCCEPQETSCCEPQTTSCCEPQETSCCGPQTTSCCEPQTTSCCEPQTTSCCEPQTTSCCEPQTTSCCEPQETSCCEPQATSCCEPKAASCCDVAKKKLDIDFLYLDLNTCERCIATGDTLDEALIALAPVFQSLNYEINVNKVNISSRELAEQYRFISSPTIRVNGVDITAELKESTCGDCSSLSGCDTDCRVFVYEGKDYEQPPTAMIVDGIMRVLYGGLEKNDTPYTLPENLEKFFTGVEAASSSSDCGCGSCGC